MNLLQINFSVSKAVKLAPAVNRLDMADPALNNNSLPNHSLTHSLLPILCRLCQTVQSSHYLEQYQTYRLSQTYWKRPSLGV